MLPLAVPRPDALRSFVEDANVTVAADDHIFEPRAWHDREDLQAIVHTVLRKCADRRWGTARREWEAERMNYREVDEDDPNLLLNVDPAVAGDAGDAEAIALCGELATERCRPTRKDRGTHRAAGATVRAGAWRPVPYPLRPAPLPAPPRRTPQYGGDDLPPAAQQERETVRPRPARVLARTRGYASSIPTPSSSCCGTRGAGAAWDSRLAAAASTRTSILWMITGDAAAGCVRGASRDDAREGL